MPARATIADFLRRLLAAGGSALVLALTLLAASPSLHEHVHDATHTHHDESCPIVLFASSADAPPAPLLAPAPSLTAHTLAPTAPRELSLSRPRSLHPPERGPPLV